MIRAKRIYMLCDEVTIWIMIIYNIFFFGQIGYYFVWFPKGGAIFMRSHTHTAYRCCNDTNDLFF